MWNNKGFTLLEVLIAVAIIAIAFAALLNVLGQDSRQAQRLHDQWLAQLATENTLAQLKMKAVTVPMSPYSVSGEWVNYGKHWRWHASCQQQDKIAKFCTLQITAENTDETLSSSQFLQRAPHADR